MKQDRILIIGAGGQIGVEMASALRKSYGQTNVVAADLKKREDIHPLLRDAGPYESLDAKDGNAILEVVRRYKITQIYHLAAMLSATGEKYPEKAWELNMGSLLNILNIGDQEKLDKIYWPSSIAVFGPTTPRDNTAQKTIIEPATIYGISKYTGELWCQHFHKHKGLDVRSMRYPGLISWRSEPGGGTTDYAIDIYIEALKHGSYSCFLSADTYLPMMYMDDAIRATISLMEAPAENIANRMSYNLSAMSFCPSEIADSIRKQIPGFTISYAPDYRQAIADGWPKSIDDSEARKDWGWKHNFGLDEMTDDMLTNLRKKLGV